VLGCTLQCWSVPWCRQVLRSSVSASCGRCTGISWCDIDLPAGSTWCSCADRLVCVSNVCECTRATCADSATLTWEFHTVLAAGDSRMQVPALAAHGAVHVICCLLKGFCSDLSSCCCINTNTGTCQGVAGLPDRCAVMSISDPGVCTRWFACTFIAIADSSARDRPRSAPTRQPTGQHSYVRANCIAYCNTGGG
jgi:hypothetical protein